MDNMSEDAFQSKCYMWFHHEYPELRGLLCYNLNNSKHKVRAMMDKGMGLQKGRSDMVFYYDARAYMIELKVGKNDQLDDQIEWQKKIERAGFYYCIIRTLEDFQMVIKNIIDK